MGISDWRTKRQLKDPVRGVFRVTDCYDAHPHESNSRPRLTGVVTALGTRLPVRIDPARPSRVVIDVTGQP